MKWIYLACALMAVAVPVLWFESLPHRTLKELHLAATLGDQAAVAKVADLDSIRAAYSVEARAVLIRTAGDWPADPMNRMAGVLARHIDSASDAAGAAMATTGSLLDLMSNGEEMWGYTSSWLSTSRFRAEMSRPSGQLVIDLERDGFTWRVVRVSLPDEWAALSKAPAL